MPDNIPGWLDQATGNKLIISVLLSMGIAAARVVYDQEETQPVRIILESMLCGGLTLTAHFAVTATGLHPDWSVAAGGVIGFLGTVGVKTLALKYIINKAEK